MRAQASTADPKKRKESFDRVQEIVAEQTPFIYLVNQNALSAVSGAVEGANPGILSPQTFWNADRLTLNASTRASRQPSLYKYDSNDGYFTQRAFRAGDRRL